MIKKENTAVAVKAKNEVRVVKPVESSNALVMALQTLRVYEASDKQIVAYLSPAIEKARFDLGLRMDNINAKDNKLFIDSILKDLKENFSAMTIGEIPICIYNFSRGKYHLPGKDVFLTAAQLTNGFKGYAYDPDRLGAKQELLQLQAPTPEELEPTEAEIEEKRLAMIWESFDEFKSTGAYQDHFNYIFQAIQHYRMIPFTGDQKRKIFEEARLFLIATNKQQATDGKDKKKRALNIKLLELIIVKDVPMTEAMQLIKTSVKVQAMQIALNRFYADLIKHKTDIKQFLAK